MRKRLLTLGLASVIGTSALFSTQNVFASENVNQQIRAKKQEISDLKQNEINMLADMKQIDAKVAQTNAEMNKTKAEVADTKKNLNN